MAENYTCLDFAQVHREATPLLRNYIRKLTNDSNYADDLVSRTWLNFIKSLNRQNSYDSSKSKVSTYLCRIVHNLWVDDLRTSHNSKTRSLDDEFPDTFSELSINEMDLPNKNLRYFDPPFEDKIDLVEKALRRILPEDRRILSLRYLLNMSPGEIAVLDKVTRGTISRRLNIACGKFKREYLKLTDD